MLNMSDENGKMGVIRCEDRVNKVVRSHAAFEFSVCTDPQVMLSPCYSPITILYIKIFHYSTGSVHARPSNCVSRKPSHSLLWVVLRRSAVRYVVMGDRHFSIDDGAKSSTDFTAKRLNRIPLI